MNLHSYNSQGMVAALNSVHPSLKAHAVKVLKRLMSIRRTIDLEHPSLDEAYKLVGKNQYLIDAVSKLMAEINYNQCRTLPRPVKELVELREVAMNQMRLGQELITALFQKEEKDAQGTVLPVLAGNQEQYSEGQSHDQSGEHSGAVLQPGE